MATATATATAAAFHAEARRFTTADSGSRGVRKSIHAEPRRTATATEKRPLGSWMERGSARKCAASTPRGATSRPPRLRVKQSSTRSTAAQRNDVPSIRCGPATPNASSALANRSVVRRGVRPAGRFINSGTSMWSRCSAPCALRCGIGSYFDRKSQPGAAERMMSPARDEPASVAICTIASG